MDRQMPPNVSFLSGRDTAPAYWMYNILWVPLIEDTKREAASRSSSSGCVRTPAR